MPKTTKIKRQKLIDLLVSRAVFSDADKAQRAVWAGEVIVNDEMVDQPGTLIAENSDIRLRKEHSRYVSRGGEKLEAALTAFQVEVTGRVVLDVGASTGGFTDCLLQHGAQRVYAVDIGKGQLAHRLQTDPRVVDMGGHDITGIQAPAFDPNPDLATIDVTFESLEEIVPKTRAILAGEKEVIALLKPLFEARLLGIGYVKDVQRHVFEQIIERFHELQIPINSIIASPVPGSGGAVEFFLHVHEPGRSREELWQFAEIALAHAKELLTTKTKPSRSGRNRRYTWRKFNR